MPICKYCNGRGLYPFCPKCEKSIDFEIELALRKVDRASKPPKDYVQDNFDEIERFKYLEERKDIRRMVKNMFKITDIPDEAKDQIEELIESGQTYIEIAAFIRGNYKDYLIDEDVA
ncbi:MAG: hypothetical protein KGN01_07950 [Patescibacteria group bacterium]|nr:hypothetical protein [Patescibacteria group bacterium]MDE2439295.1 hypothetical protein [Patescibacteria group bacterium]